MGDSDRRAAVGHAVAELVDRLGLVQPRQTQVVVRSVHGDVLVLVLVERRHEGLEVRLSTRLAHVGRREIGMHARTVPIHVLAEGLAMPVDFNAVLFAEAHQNVAGNPDLVGGGFGTLAKDLKFPLSLGDFGIDALVVDARIETLFEVLFDDFAGDVTDGLVANTRVVFTLRVGEPTPLWEAKGSAIFVEEIFLLEAEPSAGVVQDGCASVALVRSHTIGHHHFAHHQSAVLAGGVGINSHRLQDTVGATSLSLAGRTAVEIPEGQLLQLRKALKILDLGFAAEVRDWLVTIEPDVFQFVFSHGCEW